MTGAEMVDVVRTAKMSFLSFAVKFTKNHTRTMKLAERFGLVGKVLTQKKVLKRVESHSDSSYKIYNII